MELIDIYNEHGEKIGKTQDRSLPLAPGEYQLGAIVVVVNKRGELLLTLRSPQKRPYPNQWENTGGGALASENAKQAAVRELFEETGILCTEDELTHLYRLCRVQPDGRGILNEIFALHRELDPKKLTLQLDEAVDAKWIAHDEWEHLARADEILTPAGPNDETFFSILRSYIESIKSN